VGLQSRHAVESLGSLHAASKHNLHPCAYCELQAQQPIGAAAGVAHDGAVDWGHLKADVVQYGSSARQYDILAGDSGDEKRGVAGAAAAGPRGGPPVPRGAATGANMAPLPPRCAAGRRKRAMHCWLACFSRMLGGVQHRGYSCCTGASMWQGLPVRSCCLFSPLPCAEGGAVVQCCQPG
jgi:hypothetical protein